MVLISKDRVHMKGTLTELLLDFGMLSATMEKRFNLTLDQMKHILEIAHDDLAATESSRNDNPEERTISIVFKRGSDIFNL